MRKVYLVYSLSDSRLSKSQNFRNTRKCKNNLLHELLEMTQNI